MTKTSDRNDLIRYGADLLARLDSEVREAENLSLALKVERLLQSAAPGLGIKFWYSMSGAYEDEIYDGAPSDPFWDEFFSDDPDNYCGCLEEDGCKVGEGENIEGFSTFVYFSSMSPNDLDVLENPPDGILSDDTRQDFENFKTRNLLPDTYFCECEVCAGYEQTLCAECS